jgi:hypothetical protein
VGVRTRGQDDGCFGEARRLGSASGGQVGVASAGLAAGAAELEAEPAVPPAAAAQVVAAHHVAAVLGVGAAGPATGREPTFDSTN